MNVQATDLYEKLFSDRRQWTLPAIASERVRQSANKTFVQEAEGESESYGQFWAHSRALAGYLQRQGIKPGDRLVILACAGIPALHAWMAAALLGGIDVSVNTGYRGEPLRHVLAIANPAVIIAESDLLGALAEVEPEMPALRHLVVIGDDQAPPEARWLDLVERHSYRRILTQQIPPQPAPVNPGDIATVIFTSGTTGPSKGVLMPHGQVCLIALQAIEATGMGAEDLFYSAHPLFHIAGKFMGVFAIFAVGGTLVLDQKFSADRWLEKVRRIGATVSIVHGPMIEMIHGQPHSPRDRDHRIRKLMCCPLPKGIADAFRARFGFDTVEMWGMTEIGCPCWTSLQPEPVPGSCGKVLTDWYELAIVDPQTDEPLGPGEAGEIVVRPRHPWTTMRGYMGMPEASVEAWRNLWFHTGDAGQRDAEGNVFFIDRLGDRIRRRSENIASYDIELAVMQHPEVRECTSIGVPSGFEGDDDIMVFVVPEAGVAEPDPLELLRFLATRLPHFMVPRYIEVIDQLPRTPTNKVRKKELRQRGISEATWDRKAAGVALRELSDRNA